MAQNTFYMKEEFLKTWRGPVNYGKQNQWSEAQGSSLSNKDQKVLKSGGVVLHPKPGSLTKVFVRDESGHLWSVIIHNAYLDALEKKLKEVGYQLPTVAWFCVDLSKI